MLDQQSEALMADTVPTQPTSMKPSAPAQTMEVKQSVEIDIVGPLAFWITILVIGVIIEFVLIPVTKDFAAGNTGLTNLLTEIAGWILYLPGSVILPLVVGIWVGERVGSSRNRVGAAVTAGLINAVYAALIYVVAIFIIYMLVTYIAPAFVQSTWAMLTNFIEYAVVVPVVIVVLLVPFIGALSAARHHVSV